MGDSRSVEETEEEPSSTLLFYLNGKKIVEENPDPEWTLLHYLRFKLRLSGSKESCGEGGCGACTVLQSRYNPTSAKIENVAINACLTPLCSCHATALVTTEGLGNTRAGLHPVQERIAKSHGTQCGYCTPGFVMSMYALLRNNPEPSEAEMEDAFQGNLCRCTGYRPILQGYKTLCQKQEAQGNGVAGGGGCCGKEAGCCMMMAGQKEIATGLFNEADFQKYDPKQDLIFPPELQLDQKLAAQSLRFESGSVKWLRPANLLQLLRWKMEYPNSKLIAGNTEVGIETRFKRLTYPLQIHVAHLPELVELRVEKDVLRVGGAVTLSRLKTFCEKLAESAARSGTVTAALAEMLQWFAGTQIRNMGTLAGNLMTASPISDLSPILMGCGARVIVRSLEGGIRCVPVDASFFPRYRTTAVEPTEIVLALEIPMTQEDTFVWAVKQARRREDDIAIVNSCMSVSLHPHSRLVTSCALVFGGMAPTTKLAERTSTFLVGRALSQVSLSEASELLFEELELSADTPGGMVAYRQVLCQSFLRRFFEAAGAWTCQCPPLHPPPKDLPRKGVQLYQIVPASQKVEDLIGRPVPHLSSLKHATGEATYTDDELPISGQLYGYLLPSPVAHGKLVSVDASKALLLPGVVAVLTAKDIPKERNACGPIIPDEEIFASEVVQCQGQPVGILVAEDPLVAEKAARLVHLQIEEYPPVITIEDALEAKSFHAVKHLKAGDVEEAFAAAEHVLSGEMRIGGQEHFYMETQSCICTPHEDHEMEVLISCQGPDLVQKGVAKALGVPCNRVKVRCRRMGGAFGGKETRTLMISLPTAVAAQRLGRSVRTVMNRHDDMVATGGRHPFLCRYRVAFSGEGRVLGVEATLASNGGWSWDSSPVVMEKAMMSMDAAYTIPNWNLTGFVCKTNLPSNTAFRGYGGPQASIFLENILDQVAETVGKSPVEVRHMHLKVPGLDTVPLGYPVEECTVAQCWDEVVRMSDYERRREEVARWNEAHTWTKRGITVMPMKHDVGFHFGPMNQAGALVMIYSDGSVALHHGGTEMGQGLATKMAQVAGRVLEIPLEKIYWSEASTDKVPNTTATCGSFSSDLNGMAVKNACEILKERLAPVKARLAPTATWEEVVAAAYFERVNLSAVGFHELELGYDFEKPGDVSRKPALYSVYGVAVSEVEVDMLTGDHTLRRTDIVIDIGESLNPAVDVGQIEGAFMQGYGLFTMEELLYSPRGLLLTKGPGMYKVPGLGDIPRHFNVALLRGTGDPKAVYSSKGVGEPPLFLAASVYFAIKEALKGSRRDRGLSSAFRLDCPATAERIRLAVEDDTVRRVREHMDARERKEGKKGAWALTV